MISTSRISVRQLTDNLIAQTAKMPQYDDITYLLVDAFEALGVTFIDYETPFSFAKCVSDGISAIPKNQQTKENIRTIIMFALRRIGINNDAQLVAVN